MRRESWWQQTTRARGIALAIAVALSLAFAFLVPALASLLPDRIAALLRPSFALAVLAGLLLIFGGTIADLNRRHDKVQD